MRLRFPERRGPNHAPINIRHSGVQRTRGERIADGLAARVGSWSFIVVQSFLLVVWVVANGFLIKDWIGGEPFDPYPFILLNLVLSFQAAYTGPIVLMSQNRQAARDRDEAEGDYQVNREALDSLKRLQEGQTRMEQVLAHLVDGNP